MNYSTIKYIDQYYQNICEINIGIIYMSIVRINKKLKSNYHSVIVSLEKQYKIHQQD